MFVHKPGTRITSMVVYVSPKVILQRAGQLSIGQSGQRSNRCSYLCSIPRICAVTTPF